MADMKKSTSSKPYGMKARDMKKTTAKPTKGPKADLGPEMQAKLKKAQEMVKRYELEAKEDDARYKAQKAKLKQKADLQNLQNKVSAAEVENLALYATDPVPSFQGPERHGYRRGAGYAPPPEYVSQTYVGRPSVTYPEDPGPQGGVDPYTGDVYMQGGDIRGTAPTPEQWAAHQQAMRRAEAERAIGALQDSEEQYNRVMQDTWNEQSVPLAASLGESMAGAIRGY